MPKNKKPSLLQIQRAKLAAQRYGPQLPKPTSVPTPPPAAAKVGFLGQLGKILKHPATLLLSIPPTLLDAYAAGIDPSGGMAAITDRRYSPAARIQAEATQPVAQTAPVKAQIESDYAPFVEYERDYGRTGRESMAPEQGQSVGLDTSAPMGMPIRSTYRDFIDNSLDPAGLNPNPVVTAEITPATEPNRLQKALENVERSNFDEMELLTEDELALASPVNYDRASRAFLDYNGPGGSLGALRARDEALDLAYAGGQYYGIDRSVPADDPQSLVQYEPKDADLVKNREEGAQAMLEFYKQALTGK